ncbi:MAG TPA: hypothetical protein VGP82_18580 [Ktedonobacterales bacterium]|jgi:hypothetical protein|nr:hypothetical protein [Ktedonobacterales bacterium]
MTWNSMDSMDTLERHHHDTTAGGGGDAGEAGNTREEAGRATNPADPLILLEEELEALQEQVAVLEEGLPRAPGMERAALFKELSAYRAALAAKRKELARRGGSGSAPEHHRDDAEGGRS